MVSFWIRSKSAISSLNLFHNECPDRDIVHCQRLVTRFYLILFVLIFVILVIYICITEKTTVYTINSPDLSTIEELRSFYPDTLNCPCNQISIPYNKLVNDRIIYHEICSSEFVSQEWIEESYQANITYIWPLDIRALSSAFSQILRSYCLLSNRTVNNARVSFASQSMITTKLLSSSQFNIQIRSLSQFIQNVLITNLYSMIIFSYGILEGNQLISGLETNVVWELHPLFTTYRMISVEIIYGGVQGQQEGCPCSKLSLCFEPAGLFLDVNYTRENRFSKEMYNGLRPAIMIEGWKGGCYPVESLLVSTLECFYNSTCINLIISNNKQIQPLYQNSTSTVVLEILSGLFINEWNSTFSYSNYLKECAPQLCTYSHVHRNNFIEIITILFGLIGTITTGLKLFIQQVILRLLIFITKRRRRRQVISSNHVSNVQQVNRSLKERLISFIQRSIRKIMRINVFSETIWIRQENIERQLWASRFFLVGIILACVIETIFISIEKTTKQIIILSPNQSQFENFSLSNKINLQCPCKNIVVNYEKFFDINPTYHQICTSKFVDQNWYLRLSSWQVLTYDDFRSSALSHFRLIYTLCYNINRTIAEVIDRFGTTPFINHYILEEKFFQFRARSIADHFIKTTTNQFAHTLRLIRSITTASQFITFADVIGYGHVTSDFHVFHKQSKFDWTGLSQPECYCSRDLHCQKETNIYYLDHINYLAKILFTVPGMITGCFPLDSLLQSSLVCLYNKTCLNHTLSFFSNPYIQRISLDPNKTTRFDHDTKLETIVNELFIEDWRIEKSYSSFYNECMPTHCIYSVSTNNDNLFLIITLIAFYGGLSQALEIILPHLVNLIAQLINKLKRRDNQDNDSYILRIRSKILEFNIFRSTRHNPVITRQQRIVTRLYIIILFILLIALASYKGIRQYPMIGRMEEPSQTQFEDLYEIQGESLQCSVSQISTEYLSFLNISYSTHEICMSDFLKKNFTDYLFYEIDFPLAQDDFRPHGLTFFHLLNVLCLSTKELLTDSLNELNRQSLINTRVLSAEEFQSEIESILLKFKQKLANDFMQSLKIFQDYVQGNQLITLTGTNWKFSTRYNETFEMVRSTPIVRSNCSCATSNLCFDKAKLYSSDNPILTIEGFQIGCTPLDSILSSTLQCLYKQSCINYLIDTFEIPFNMHILQLNKSQFSLNTTIETLVKNLFIEQWNSSLNYSNYYVQIRPMQCFYSYIKRNNLFNVIIEILATYGGLSIILRFILPNIFRLLVKITKRCQNQRQTVPLSTIDLQQ